ncbi:MAG: hypothetical protein COV30_00650 [Candidatus Yanofskybacteria bacterium CG10_big_fil_rev_8_21_14_0_10_37_15]|uniref:Oligoendopeptidase F n=1 Tax=Candidatus Yanofskybacteria bacterium CG10_big_fil_rev_8_21_14_0_10_37_15 TaxID=1975097 RepID=A0A2H0R662_9BACT|nr:MAG: hypothetical protein COV30_00650 [Candidatus Yanofskybacteria bacterium CG10_big_fil_rev_8_21_14_0_10_37_15]
MTNQKNDAEKIRWDLSLMYSSIDDPQIDLDVAEIVEKSKTFLISFKGKLGDALGNAIREYSEIKMFISKVNLYLFLKETENVSDPVVKAKVEKIKQILDQSCGEYLTFFSIELAVLEDEALVRLYEKSKIVEKHRPWIEHLRLFKPHFLSESVESAITKRSSFSADAWDQFFDELEADLEFDFDGLKKTLPEIIHFLTESKDTEERFKVLKIINSGLNGMFAKYSAQTLYMVTGSEAVERRERSYKHPMEKINKINRIPDVVVDALHKAVENTASPLTKRYYRLKAAHLGLKILKWSDRNAPMPFADSTYVSFDEALSIVLSAYESFSPTLARIICNLVNSKTIDAPAVKGKRGGAFNYSAVLPGNVPVSFTMLNYLGSSRDVMTMAHELGHSVHGILAGKEQGPLMFRAPIAFSETASVFGEITTFNFLRKKLIEKGDLRSLLALIMGKIDDVINTMVRQIGFSNFERRIHGIDKDFNEWKEPEKLSVKQLSEIWLETLKQLYGEDGDVFTYENTELLWSYVSHFHRPFYVYGYAFGQLLTNSLFAVQSKFGKKFEQLYLDMLKSGSTKDAVGLLKPFDLDPTNEKFWIDAINAGLGQMIEEAEELSRDMGIVV